MTEMKNSVRQRANGTWEGRYYGADGKQHSVYGGSKSEVKDKLAAKRTEISQGGSITETDLTVAQWGREWLDNFKANRVKHSTMDNYETYFRLHLYSIQPGQACQRFKVLNFTQAANTGH